MPSRQETKRGLQQEYITRALRLRATQLVLDPARGLGYALALQSTTPETAVQLEIYPSAHALILRAGLFTLDCIDVTDVRRSGHRLRFAASTGSRRVGITLTRQGAVDIHYRDESSEPSPWQQGTLSWENPSDATSYP